MRALRDSIRPGSPAGSAPAAESVEAAKDRRVSSVFGAVGGGPAFFGGSPRRGALVGVALIGLSDMRYSLCVRVLLNEGKRLLSLLT